MDKNPLLFRNLKAMTVIGLWSPSNPKLQTIYNIYSKFIFIWYNCFILTQFVEMRYVYHDFKELTANASVSLLSNVGMARVYVALLRIKKFTHLVDQIRVTELKILKGYNLQQKRIFQEYSEHNWSISSKFWFLTFLTVICFIVGPSLETMLIGPQQILFANGSGTGLFKRPLVFSSWFPFDKYSDRFYHFAFVIQSISAVIGAAYLGVWNTFVVALMIFPIGQFRILQNSLRNIYDETKLNREYDGRVINWNLVKCVKHHNFIIRYIKDLDQLISPVMFLDFLVCSFMLCAIGLAAMMEGPTIQLGFTIEYLFAMLVQLFMFYWYANEIMLESLNVSKAAWDSKWYYCSPSIRKGIAFVLMRAQKPCRLSVGYFHTMSLQTFLLILRASYSYMALLRQQYGRNTNESS